MVCGRYRDALSELAAGSPAQAALEAHLGACARCRAQLAALRKALAVADRELAHLSVAEPSGRFVPRLRAAISQSVDAPAWRPVWLGPALATAATVVLMLTLFAIVRPAGEGTAIVEASSVPDSGPDPAGAVTSKKVAAVPSSSPRRASHRKPTEPEVLVPRGEIHALVQWVTLVNREQRVSALLAAADVPVNAAPPNIEIQPIEFVPLDPATNPGT